MNERTPEQVLADLNDLKTRNHPYDVQWQESHLASELVFIDLPRMARLAMERERELEQLKLQSSLTRFERENLLIAERDEIAHIIEGVDRRCEAVDGPVPTTREEITSDELRQIYKLATQHRRNKPGARQ